MFFQLLMKGIMLSNNILLEYFLMNSFGGAALKSQTCIAITKTVQITSKVLPASM